MSKEADNRKDFAVYSARQRFLRYCLVLILAGVVVFAWLSVLTFSPTDSPAKIIYPPPPIHNAAGQAGAFISYQLIYWIGKAATYVLLITITVVAGVMLTGRRIYHWPWRLVGSGLTVIATSAGSYILAPDNGPIFKGTGGVIGISTGDFLLRHCASTGSALVLITTMGVGMVLLADKFIISLLKSTLKILRRIGTGRLDRARTRLPKRPIRPARPVRPALPAPERPIIVNAAGVKTASVPRTGSSQRRTIGSEQAGYELPSLDLLAEPTSGYLEAQEALVQEKRNILQQTLEDFGVDARIVSHMTGPVVSLLELSLAPGVKVSQISSLAPDIARALSVPGVRVVSPLPGRDTVGVEIPNLDKEIVRLKELMTLAPEASEKMRLPLYLGKDAAGTPIISDLATMPHLLLAGTTGSGKSVSINAMLVSMLMTRTPKEVRLILIDPKMVEMAAFEKIPHLLCPIVNDMRRVEDILEWVATKMDERYDLFKEVGIRNIVEYNNLSAEEIYHRLGAETFEEKAQVVAPMPYYVLVIDELADLIMTSSKEVEGHIIRIAQKARAVGIHMIIATQRPSVNVVTGLIKSNIPCRISFRVASRQESRIVLDQNGAEVLLGQGDMLFLPPGTSNLVRAQGTYVDEREIRAVVRHVREQTEPEYLEELVRLQKAPTEGDTSQRDELFDQAVEIILSAQRGSVSLLQRRLQIGYTRASRIVDQMADAGILGDYKGSQARECLMSLEQWYDLKERESRSADRTNAEPIDTRKIP